MSRFMSDAMGSCPTHALRPLHILLSCFVVGMAVRSNSRVSKKSLSSVRQTSVSSRKYTVSDFQAGLSHGRVGSMPGNWYLSPANTNAGRLSAACHARQIRSKCS